MNNKYIDAEEQEIIESLNSDNWISDFDESIKNKYENIAKFTISRTKSISVDISEKDFQELQSKAISAGINHQTLVSLLIHQYNEGRIALSI